MARVKRRRNTRLLVFGFATVAGLGIAGALLNSNEEIGKSASPVYDSGMKWADPWSFDATNIGGQSYSTGDADSAPAQGAPKTSDQLAAIQPPASFDAVGSILASSDWPSIAVTDPPRLAAAQAESDDRAGAFLSGQSQPASTFSPSASGRSSPYTAAGGGSFGGGAAGLGGMPGSSADAGPLGSGIANSTSGESAHASGRHADTPPSFSAAGAASAPPGLTSVASAIGQSASTGAGSSNLLAPGNSAGASIASAQTLQTVQVPEPATLILVGAGLALLARRFRRRECGAL